jgi:hypothetical protein
MQRRPRWYVAVALVALGRHRDGDTKTPFCAADLTRWAPEFAKRSSPALAITILLRHRYVEEVDVKVKSPCLQPVVSWRMTPEGLQAAKAAAQVAQSERAGAFIEKAPSIVTPPDPFAARLWSLLHIRGALTADEASCVLVDAGDEVAGVRKRCGALLLAWSRRFPDTLQVSARRVEGQKRYVLLGDLGKQPPTAVTASTPRKGRQS